jgi:hypothetical protein
MPPDQMLAFHETRISRLETEVSETAQQIAEHRAEFRLSNETMNDKIDDIGTKLDRIADKLETQDNRLGKLETATEQLKHRGAFFRKYWSHLLLAALGAAGTVGGKFLMSWLLHR